MEVGTYERIAEKAVKSNSNKIKEVVKGINDYEAINPKAKLYRMAFLKKFHAESLQARFRDDREVIKT